MTLQIKFLADHPEAVSTVADWIFDEWAHKRAGLTREDHADEMTAQLSRTHVPIQLIALDDRAVVGIAVLKPHEMRAVYPDWLHWLGSVVVRPDIRGRGVATLMCKEIETVARRLQVPKLHLQTGRLDGGLYALVMAKNLAA